MKKSAKPKLQAEAAYENAHLTARDLIQAISEALDDMPVPENDKQPIHWGHVGEVVEVNRRLSELLEFLNSSERYAHTHNTQRIGFCQHIQFAG
jgi:hypothetical protein